MISRTQTKVGMTMGGAMVLLLIMLIACATAAVVSILFGKRKDIGDQRDGNGEPRVAQEQQSFVRPGVPSPHGASPKVLSTPLTSSSLTTQPLLPTRSGPTTKSLLPSRSGAAPSSQPNPRPLASLSNQLFPRPPLLCPALALPVVEAHFEIPMYALRQCSASDGEFTIVGISGNPTFLAAVRKKGEMRMLEVCLPGKKTAPCASITPMAQEVYDIATPRPGHEAENRSGVCEIRGMHGALYGTIEMHDTGACYVVKDDQRVLTLHGEERRSQISIKSSVGLELACAKCLATAPGSKDHLEDRVHIRIEPGVDAVLMLSLVLAVLLLSPYLPNKGEEKKNVQTWV
jgi:hypothetical protein